MKCVAGLIPCLCAVLAFGVSAAFGTPAQLDSSFSSDGKVRTNFSPGFDYAAALALQPDGKIVVAGRAEISRGGFALARYNVDGSLDTTFSAHGKTTTNFTRRDDNAEAVIVLADGDVVAAGQAGGGGRNPKFALVRYNADGTLDGSFSGDGKVVTDFTPGSDFAFAATAQADGKIVAVGAAAAGSHGRFALARYNDDGSLDPSFGGDGRVTTNLTAAHDAITGVAVQPDGNIVVAGAANDDTVFALARYKPDGTLDTTFAGDGTTMTNFTPGRDFAWDVALQPDGEIVAAGRVSARFGLARYSSDGTLDTTFGGDGRVTTNFTGGTDIATALTLQSDGKIVAVGDANDLKFAVARYKVDGSLDASFGGDGRVTTNFTRHLDFAWDVSVQTDGKIVAAGGAGGRFGVVRYMGG